MSALFQREPEFAAAAVVFDVGELTSQGAQPALLAEVLQ
jgi:hypothetical protein